MSDEVKSKNTNIKFFVTHINTIPSLIMKKIPAHTSPFQSSVVFVALDYNYENLYTNTKPALDFIVVIATMWTKFFITKMSERVDGECFAHFKKLSKASSSFLHFKDFFIIKVYYPLNPISELVHKFLFFFFYSFNIHPHLVPTKNMHWSNI